MAECSRSMTSKPPMPEPMWTPKLHGLVRRSDGEVNEATHLAGLFFVNELQRIEVLHLGGKANGMAGEIECLDLGHAALACEQALPDFGHGISDPADEAKASYDDATLFHCYLAPFWFFSM
jgi:hypothetical protein